MKALFRVHGRVQGVGFRRFVQGQAEALGLGGWVRNEPGGSVAGEVTGDLSRLEAFRDRLAQGPGWGRVTSLDWNPAPGGESLPQPFEIRN